jgi:hypothetical protein
MLLRIVNPGLARRREWRRVASRPIGAASALVRADDNPELARRLGQFALQFLH